MSTSMPEPNIDKLALAEETVVSLLTPRGHAALAAIGIRGPRAVAITKQLFTGRWHTGRPMYGNFGATIQDDVVAHLHEDDEHTWVEIHCHGGHAMIQTLMDDIVRRGANLICWQDFLSLSRHWVEVDAAEAMNICQTERAAAVLLDQYNGVLSEAFRGIESGCDAESAKRLLRWAPFGLHLVQPWKVALFGRPNVGKSSLLNAIAGFDRAIVCDMPGTTRDVVGVTVALQGWLFELFDGAGIHDRPQNIEAEGIRRYTEQLPAADLRVLIVDLSQNTDDSQSLWTTFSPDLVVGNKCDLAVGQQSAPPTLGIDLRCSAKTGEGIPELCEYLVQRLIPEVPPPGTAIPFTQKQVDLLKEMVV